ncbi:FAD-dependent oxidoreductase [Nocardia sp. NPDC056000]|uniref:FAD-dependent oxidoreductase n=1 Tax=Nocardia sp. NPDC056000 TaxID=3345674 RepID=UPI0035D5D79D
MVQQHAEVIGGGIGGLTAATALAQRGWQVRLHERDHEIRAIGAGIYMWGNGLASLEALGLFDRAVVGAHVGQTLESRDHRNRTVEAIEINRPGRARVYTILRERLIDTLVSGAKAAGVEIITDSEILRAEPDGTIVAADGRTARADLVVAADGVNSRIRDHLGLLAERARMDQGAIRLTVPRSAEFVDPADAGKYIEYFRGRRRLLYTPSSAHDLYVALVTETGDEAGTRVPIDVDSWRRSFPHLGALIERLDGLPGRWDTFEFVKLRSWSAGRVAVIGDAAHAQPPYLGQGGGCAMMNALGLADAVSTLSAGGDIAERLREWESRERPVIEHTQRWSYGLRLVNRIPDAMRSPVLTVSGRIERLGRSRMAAALSTPTGFDRFAGTRG